MNLKTLVGSGDKILLLTLPFLIVGLVLTILYPSLFSVGGPFIALQVLSIILLIPGITMWLRSVILILIMVPRQELITSGPYAIVRHPMYAGLILAALGSLLIYATWTTVYFACFAPLMFVRARREEQALSAEFGEPWQEYCRRVPMLIPHLRKG